MKFILLFFPLFLVAAPTQAQAGKLKPADIEVLKEKERKLIDLSYTMHMDSSAETRFLACKDLITGLVDALKMPNSYSFPFDSLRGVVVKNSPDESFRIFSWEMHVHADDYKHFGAIQKNAVALQLEPLLDRGDALTENPENALLAADNWLGYVVYDLVPAGKYEGNTMYFVFGFDRYGKWQRRKILDVLTFDERGKAHFGAPVFDTYSAEGLLLADRKRMILQYGAEANVVLRYEPYKQQVWYENLIMSPGPDEAGPVAMPDGSYHALELNEDGRWSELEKVFDHKYEKAPVESARDSTGLDIVGRPKKGD